MQYIGVECALGVVYFTFSGDVECVCCVHTANMKEKLKHYDSFVGKSAIHVVIIQCATLHILCMYYCI